ncbi:MAG: ATP-binding protein [Dehalococcoidia bacterium]|jgi:two-component system phosphate regulon sensor histidine kinase PhoR|nr:ATP-binding protein [Dehalococcoidia bacterium]
MKSINLKVRTALVSAGLTAAGSILVGLIAVGASADTAPVVTAVVVISALGFGVSWVLSGRLTAGIARLAAVGSRAVEGDYTARAGTGGPSEVSEASASLNHLIDRLRSALEAGGSERIRLSSILNTMTDGVLVVDDEGIVELVNPAALEMLDAPSEFWTGDRLVTLNRDHEVLRVIMDCVNERTPAQGQVELLGSRRFLNIVAVPLTDEALVDEPARTMNRALVLLNDLTELRRVDVTRTEFVANASHELRTPLAAIRASAETLQLGALNDPEAASDFLNRIEDNVLRMEGMISEMLELSRLETGQAPMHLAPISLPDVVVEEVDRLRPVAERAGIELGLDLEDDLPAITADRTMVSQVVSNLVSNALHASGKGDKVSVAARRTADGIDLSVTDTGRGIETEYVPHVFERFYKVGASRSDGGTGIGLAIVKHIAQAHGGDASVDSAPGRGSTFTVAFPLTRGFEIDPDALSEEQPHTPGDQAQPRI